MTITLHDIAASLKLAVATGGEWLEREVKGGYASDLLSDVLAHARKGNVWITLQIHPNIAAVASVKELCGIIIVQGRTPEAETLRKAAEEHLPIMVSPLATYDLACRLGELGVRNHEGV